ncbi:TPA: bacterioferritin [Candidatus Acetothermia bacterium]|nr:bacterioferritin [Candidatus Acetothermia bacterium]
MKGNAKIIEALNARLAEELGATLQYMLHAEMCANWGYAKLHDAIEKRGIAEMGHWEKLIERILFLEGQPLITKVGPVQPGSDVATIHKNDLEAEYGADRAYNDTVKLAAELGDNGTRELLEGILKDEEDHVDWLEAQLDQIKQMGIANYLSEQTG